MAKYSTQQAQSTADGTESTESASITNENIAAKVSESEPRFNEKQITVVDGNPRKPNRYEFVFQNERVVGIKHQMYDGHNEEWSEKTSVTPFNIPERVKQMVESIEETPIWSNICDVERCENFNVEN